jgi:hypothetical protein
MLLDDSTTIKAALATMNPIARDATQLLAREIIDNPTLLNENNALARTAMIACASAFARAGYDLSAHEERFERFIENHAANVMDLAVSVVLCAAKDAKRRQMWGSFGKVAALVGAAALGAFFG